MTWIFWLAASLVAYTYVGYAGWLRLRVLWRLRPVMRGAITPPVTVVMVVRNEEKILESKLKNLISLDYPQHQLQIVVVSDGSDDSTEQILREYWGDPRIHAVLNQLPKGRPRELTTLSKLRKANWFCSRMRAK